MGVPCDNRRFAEIESPPGDSYAFWLEVGGACMENQENVDDIECWEG